MSKSVEVRNMFLHPHFFTKKKGCLPMPMEAAQETDRHE